MQQALRFVYLLTNANPGTQTKTQIGCVSNVATVFATASL